MHSTTLQLLLLPLLAVPYVSAHGFVHKVWINKEEFLGNTPNADPKPSIVRQINSVEPVKGADNPAVNCGPNGQRASEIADANPGDAMSFLWTGGDLSKWPHNVGPMLTYLASCGATDCTTFDSTKAKWFKIAQDGRIPGDSNGNWFQNNMFTSPNVPANVTLPSNLAPGAYLIRHEIIALHLADTPGGAEFYPSCSQIRVGGSGTGAPKPEELVSLPGAYSDTDPGILVNVFDGAAKPYTFPGPPIAAFVSSSSNSGNSNSGSNSGGSGSPPPPPQGKPKSCKLKKTTKATKRELVVRPRHISRVMRALVLGGNTHL
ncbi:glycoside hydrolase family 61 protein [Mycena rebaudengoi]|nr:glycoside hydrolase family 61 protein [Mycena rebaudengoi]